MRLPARIVLFALLATLLPLPESVAASRPEVLSRETWGADEALGIVSQGTSETNGEMQAPANGEKPPPRELSEREKRCQEEFRKHPAEFRMGNIVTRNAEGEPYVWPRRYSPAIRLIVLHHTGGDDEKSPEEGLSGIEQVRAIYRWHTVHNGWGDVGYHYLIDKEGVIYEGRAGGDNVIGAHAYCANTGTVGVALIGNYLHALPPEAQLKSARWLLMHLSEKYALDPDGFTTFHGKRLPVIAMHKDVAETECPGRVDELVPAIRRLVAAGDFTSAMLPRHTGKPSAEGKNTLLTQGSTHLTLPRRGVARIALTYKADTRSVNIGEHLAPVERSDSRIGLWQSRGGDRIRLRNSIVTDQAIVRGRSVSLQLMLLAPAEEGTYTFSIGDVTYVLDVAGRRRQETPVQ